MTCLIAPNMPTLSKKSEWTNEFMNLIERVKKYTNECTTKSMQINVCAYANAYERLNEEINDYLLKIF